MSDTQTPLWKQLLGAGTGALVALAAYVAYDAASPALTAVLASPGAPIIRPAEPATPSSATMHDAATPEQQKAQDNIANKAKALTDSFKGMVIAPGTGTGFVTAAVSTSSEATTEEESSAWTAPMQMADQASSKATVIAGTKAGKLPNSGVGVWMGMLAAFTIAFGLQMRRHSKVG